MIYGSISSRSTVFGSEYHLPPDQGSFYALIHHLLADGIIDQRIPLLRHICRPICHSTPVSVAGRVSKHHEILKQY